MAGRKRGNILCIKSKISLPDWTIDIHFYLVGNRDLEWIWLLFIPCLLNICPDTISHLLFSIRDRESCVFFLFFRWKERKETKSCEIPQQGDWILKTLTSQMLSSWSQNKQYLLSFLQQRKHTVVKSLSGYWETNEGLMEGIASQSFYCLIVETRVTVARIGLLGAMLSWASLFAWFVKVTLCTPTLSVLSVHVVRENNSEALTTALNLEE